MKVAVAQFKPELGAVDRNFELAADFIAGAGGADVVVLPELWSTGYFPRPIGNFADKNAARTAEFISAAAKKMSLNIVAGSVIAESGGKIFNRCLVANRAGEIVAAYDKAHLFSFAREQEVFSAGGEIVTAELDGVQCGLAICYDLRFPEFIRKLALRGTEILFVPAAWSLSRLVPRQVLTKARAIENQIFVVFANSAGHSEILNPLGETLSEAGRDAQILTAEIDLAARAKITSAMNLLADRNPAVDAL